MEKKYFLSSINDENFCDIWHIMETCFASNELRTYDSQLAINRFDNYNTIAVSSDKEVVAFATWWEFGWCTFLEYIAVIECHRNKGIGTYIMKKIMQKEQLMVLEVNKKNLYNFHYYKSLGFCVNCYNYKAIPLKTEYKKVPNYYLMSYPRPFSQNEFDQFIGELSKSRYN